MALSTGSALLDWLDGWGPELRSRVHMAQQKAWTEVAPNMTGESTVHSPMLKPGLRVGTDCSGIEAPIHALKAMGIPHRHSWSSEVAAAPRKVLLENTPPADHMYQDVLQSSKVNAPYVHLYVSGFSCKPFSMLHHKTRLLHEKESAIFFAVVDRIHKVMPPSFVLENVLGIRRVLPEVLKALTDSGLYSVIVLEMDPSNLAEPVLRPRLYFLGVRKDVALADELTLKRIVERSWELIKQEYRVHCPESRVTLASRLLPVDHPAVLKQQALHRQRWMQARHPLFFWKSWIVATWLFN